MRAGVCVRAIESKLILNTLETICTFVEHKQLGDTFIFYFKQLAQ